MSAHPRPQAFWLITLATVVAMSVTAALGFWQLGRASDKEAWRERQLQRTLLPALTWEDLQAFAVEDAALERKVELKGRWLHEATVFLDNRPMSGRVGFVVVTPLLPSNGGAAILVQRGWVPRRFDDRTAVPVLRDEPGEVTVVGTVAPAPSKLYEFASGQEGSIRQNIDVEAFSSEWSIQLLPLSVQQRKPSVESDGLLRDWVRPGVDVHKHYGYALQWFGLFLLIGILYVWFQFISPRRRRA